MALGEELKQARMRRKLTASEVAAHTRMKVQTVTELEEEDFSKMAAPIYAKGFIRLYAEYVGLDPHALIQEYIECFAEGKTSPSRPVAASPEVEEPALPVAEPESVKVVLPSEAPSPVDDLDLFSEVEPATNDRRGIFMDEGYQGAAPSLRTRAHEITVNAVGALRHAGNRTSEVCRNACRNGVRLVADGCKRLVETVVARRRELTQLDFKNLSAKHMMALLGVLVLVLLIISSLSRCVRGQGHTSGRTPPPLPVAAEPDDMFLD